MMQQQDTDTEDRIQESLIIGSGGYVCCHIEEIRVDSYQEWRDRKVDRIEACEMELSEMMENDGIRMQAESMCEKST